MFRSLNALMAILFAVAIVVQYNDPDPLVWMAIYGAACVVCTRTAASGRISRTLAALVAAIALVWSAVIITGVRDITVYEHMFDAWEMKSLPIEEAREASGLLITAAWMSVLWARPLWGRR